MTTCRKGEEVEEPIIFVGGGDGIPTPGFCNSMLAGGTLFIYLALHLGENGWRQSEAGSYAGGLLFFGCVILGIGVWLWCTRRSILALFTSSQVSQQLGISDEELPELAQKHSVKPRYLVNGQPFYDITDFNSLRNVEAMSLLRGTIPPNDPQAAHVLLRTVCPVSEHHSEQLLRVPSTAGTAGTNRFTTMTPSATSEQQVIPQ